MARWPSFFFEHNSADPFLKPKTFVFGFCQENVLRPEKAQHRLWPQFWNPSWGKTIRIGMGFIYFILDERCVWFGLTATDFKINTSRNENCKYCWSRLSVQSEIAHPRDNEFASREALIEAEGTSTAPPVITHPWPVDYCRVRKGTGSQSVVVCVSTYPGGESRQ